MSKGKSICYIAVNNTVELQQISIKSALPHQLEAKYSFLLQINHHVTHPKAISVVNCGNKN